MSHKTFFVLIIFACLPLAACSTIMEGSTQKMAVETPGAEGAVCFLQRDGFKYRVYPPKVVHIKRSNEEMVVHCIAPGNREKTVIVEPKIATAALFNVSNGVLPGGAWDAHSGALFAFPEKLSIDFTGVPSKPRPLPDYQRLLKENPLLADMEEFRPGQSALQRDKHDTAPTLEKISREDQLIMRSTDFSDVTGGSYSVVGGESDEGASDGGSEGGSSGANLVMDDPGAALNESVPVELSP